MKRLAPLLLTIALPLPVAAVQVDKVPSVDRADALMRRRQWKAAEAAFEKITAAQPRNGYAWFQLGSARHALKDWAGAVEANLRAAESPGHRPSALYNVACARSLAGEVEAAGAALREAREAGFLDIDLMAADSDLDRLRATGAVKFPRERTYQAHKGRNGVLMRYALLEPRGFDRERAYPVLAVFAPGAGPRSADWMMEELLADVDQQDEWVVLCVIPPETKGWFTHPTHHALEDLLKAVKKKVKVEGDRFHLFGIASGSAPALTYSNMSRKYFQSMVLVGATAWSNYDEEDYPRWKGMSVLQIAGEDSYTLELNRQAHEQLKRHGAHSKLTVIPENGVLVPSLRGADLLAVISEGLQGHSAAR